MMKMKILGVFAAALMLAGCGTTYERLAGTEPSGSSAFTDALFTEYKALADFEANEMYDWADADLFADKAMRAAAGEVVLPEELADWDLPADKIDELAEGRSALLALLDASARDKFPKEAAYAQGRFDCWVEQQEENHQPAHIAACRDEFLAALADLQELMEPAEVEPPAPAAPPTYVVLFAFDSAQVTDLGREVIKAAVIDARQRGAEVAITGHADRAGPADYNMRLSIRRAEAVQAVMTEMGLGQSRMSVAGRGESEPAVPTEDGVREQANRRVVIQLQ